MEAPMEEALEAAKRAKESDDIVLAFTSEKCPYCESGITSNLRWQRKISVYFLDKIVLQEWRLTYRLPYSNHHCEECRHYVDNGMAYRDAIVVDGK
ncbi:hypothetical protein HDU96_002131, partial [Phlyctochytrium bullatum]